jgi:hypothetical protein
MMVNNEKGLSPVTLPFCETSAIGFEIKKKIKNVKCKFSMVDASTAPSPVPFALERICIHMLDN